jgi:hypothetical protein
VDRLSGVGAGATRKGCPSKLFIFSRRFVVGISRIGKGFVIREPRMKFRSNGFGAAGANHFLVSIGFIVSNSLSSRIRQGGSDIYGFIGS